MNSTNIGSEMNVTRRVLCECFHLLFKLLIRICRTLQEHSGLVIVEMGRFGTNNNNNNNTLNMTSWVPTGESHIAKIN